MISLRPANIPEAVATPSLKAMVVQHGQENAVKAVAAVITQSDMMLGGGMQPGVLVEMAHLFIDQYQGRPIGTIIMGVRRGMQQKTIGHKLTYPLLCQWMEDMDAAVEEHNYNEHLRTK
jgi:hypothetical protein